MVVGEGGVTSQPHLPSISLSIGHGLLEVFFKWADVLHTRIKASKVIALLGWLSIQGLNGIVYLMYCKIFVLKKLIPFVLQPGHGNRMIHMS